ncbi:MAG: hypothetical protein JO110_16565, partial [Acetobacteraceae bacterium]|nr:hypothetical protein [Acetobacteraceae bacterium]
RLWSFVRGLSSTDRIIAIALNSPGGSIVEAAKLARVIRREGVPVIVPSGGGCASACFLMFAAAQKKVAAADAVIGVHSASLLGHENLLTMGFTTAMARSAAEYGVPAAIIGRMVQTPPGTLARLTHQELASMGVIILPASAEARSAPGVPSQHVQAATPQPSTAGAAPPPVDSLSFQQGLADRAAWEAWLQSTSGDYRNGAEYWANQRSLSNLGACTGPGGLSLGNWTSGCLAARRRLAYSDARRKVDPEYRLGWNSF